MLFATMPSDTRNAVRDLILTRLAEAGYNTGDIKRCTSTYEDDHTIVRIQFKSRNREQSKFGNLVIKLPGKVEVQSNLILPA